MIGRHEIQQDGVWEEAICALREPPLIRLAGMGFCGRGVRKEVVYASRETPLIRLAGLGVCRMGGLGRKPFKPAREHP